MSKVEELRPDEWPPGRVARALLGVVEDVESVIVVVKLKDGSTDSYTSRMPASTFALLLKCLDVRLSRILGGNGR